MGKALILVGVALTVGLLVYWLASSRAPAPSAAPPFQARHSERIETAPGKLAGEPRPQPVDTGPIDPPKSAEEKERETLDLRRRPLYAQLRHDLGAALAAVRPSDDDAATLEIYAAQDAPGNTITLLNLALRDNIAYYGFRHIQFFAPNPAGSIEKFRLDAEANGDSAGNWQTFKK